MSLTKDEWDKIKTDLSLYGFVELTIDEYIITLRVRSTKNFLVRNIFIYVNGEFNSEWVYSKKDKDPCFEDIRRRFLRKRNKGLSSVANLRKKGWRKKDAEKFVAERMFTYYDPHWTSFETLKSHLIKNNKDISRG